MNSKIILIIFIVVLGISFFASAYVVNETEQVVITQFGKVMGKPVISPGLKFRIPFIQTTNYFPKNLLEWDGDPGQIPTLDKTYIWVDVFARWKIVNPIKFFQTVNNTIKAISKLNDIIDPAVRNYITSYSLIEAVRSSNRELDTFEVDIDDTYTKEHNKTYSIDTGRDKITKLMLDQAKPKLDNFGIELVDIKIKRINYVEQVRKSVYGRMIAERNQIAEKFRSEGKGEAQKIIGDKERELKKISSEAYRTAQEIMGIADGKATSIYADSYGVDPEFYSFIKSLETYGQALEKNSSIILSTDNEFLRFIKNYSGKK